MVINIIENTFSDSIHAEDLAETYILVVYDINTDDINMDVRICHDVL